MHIPCSNCATGWVLPEVGHTHLRACPLCHGTGYLTAQGAAQGSEQEVAFMRTQYGEASVEQGAGQRIGQNAGREPEANTYSPSFDPQTA